MLCLIQNKQDVSYALYSSKEKVYDDFQNFTGEYTVTYKDIITTGMNVSPAKKTAYMEEFGINNRYTITLITDDMQTPFNTDTVFWIGISPDGNEPNYIADQISRSLNSVTIYVKEVDMS